MSKKAIYQQELEKLTKAFADVEDSKRQLVEGLIEDAAFLRAENTELRKLLEKIGMVNVNPNNPMQQKPVEASKQYMKNVNSYSVIVRTLNGILNKNIMEDEDELSDFE